VPAPGLGEAEIEEHPLVQAGGEHADPYRKTVEVTFAPFGVTLPDSVAPLAEMFAGGEFALTEGASSVLNWTSAPQELP
jgi:hypothetical protein